MRTINSPAIIANSQDELSGILNSVKGYASRIMLDIMDGVFVPSKSLDFHFSVTQARMLSSIEVSSNSDKVFNEETISFCLGYAVRVTEEYERLFGDMK